MDRRIAEPADAAGFFARAPLWQLLFGPWSLAVGLVVVAGAVSGALWLDPGAIGVDFCWFRRTSGLPCPGCGLTRSVVALARGEFSQSMMLHPFGAGVLIWALAAASSPLWPRALRRAVEVRLELWRRPLDRVYQGLIIGFVGFGLARVLGSLLKIV